STPARLSAAKRLRGGFRSAADAGVAELVVLFALGLIRQNVVSLLHFLEFLGGLRVVPIHIGMVLANELAVCLLDLVLRSRFRNAQNVVIITLGHTVDG